jgi:DUF4097 and DUF4098 domain-containing protein YvlB
MPTFDTPEPIFATVKLAHGTLRLIATERTDTVVEVRPTRPSSSADVKDAEHTQVEYAHGRLAVTGPEPRAWGRTGSVEVTIELPAGSHLNGEGAAVDFRCDGPLGECTVRTASGDIQLGQTGELRASTASGDITATKAAGRTEVTAGSGNVDIREIDGAAVVKNSNGTSKIGEVTGELRVSGANGDIVVERALADLIARTANGNIRVGEVVRGSVSLEAAAGNLEIGIRTGTVAWLDASSLVGSVQNRLDTTGEPGRAEEKVEVRARTVTGNILLQRV